MRIRNVTKIPRWSKHASAKGTGATIGPGLLSSELPLERMLAKELIRDVAAGTFTIVLTPKERATLEVVAAAAEKGEG